MSELDDDTDLRIIEEHDEIPHVEYDISVSPSDPNLELIAKQIERGDSIHFSFARVHLRRGIFRPLRRYPRRIPFYRMNS